MHLFPKQHFDFLGRRWTFFAISGVILGASIISLATRGVKYGIDFTGGTTIQMTFDKPLDLGKLRAAADKAGWKNASIQEFPGTNTFSLRVQSEEGASAEKMETELKDLQGNIPDDAFKVDSKSYVGPAVSRQLASRAVWAIVLSLAGIIIYLGFRFANPIWGVAGVIALFHDVLATYGLFSIWRADVDLLIVSAILTIGGYSIHDTIVIFDRMREKMHIQRGKYDLGQLMNESMNETLSRTVITSMTVLVVVLILWLFGGQVIHHFAMAMVFGCIVGTYSSVAVAAPLVYEWSLRSQKKHPSATPSKPKQAGKK